MKEAQIKFERENLEGVIPVGTYLSDAARRMGVYWDTEESEETDFFIVKVTKGGELLSAPTNTETERLSIERRNAGERLAEHAKIEKPGEIVIMTTEKKVEEKASYEVKKEEYRKEFEELPLEKKIASLVELEVIALSETFSFVINSPYLIFGKIVDVLAEFGWKIEDEAKKQSRPAEHHANEEPSVTESKKDTAPESSIKADDHTGDSKPSVKESVVTGESKPSIKEDGEDDAPGEKESPPPSV